MQRIAVPATLVVAIVIAILNASVMQPQEVVDWQAAAGGRMSFEVASVKLRTGPFVAPSFPLDAAEAYRPTGGRFRADFPLWTYIQFAYKIAPAEEQRRKILAQLPGWVTTDRYAIEARGPGNPTKDQMRLMMQSLLADRFQLKVHFENKEFTVFLLSFVAPGKLGPKLRSHSEGRPCGDFAAWSGTPAADGTFPPICDSPALIRKANGTLMLLGYRSATMDLVADSLSGPRVWAAPSSTRPDSAGDSISPSNGRPN